MDVSVIIPSYNHDRFVAESIQSVLSQTGVSFELIVIDDGSSDNSKDIINSLSKKHGFRFISKENEGLCATINLGIFESIGTYIVVFASDDIMPMGRLAEQVHFLETHQNIDVVAGAMIYIDSKSKKVSEKQPFNVGKITFESMLRKNSLYAPTAMIRKSIFDRFGNYNPNYLIEDYFLWLKILKHGCSIYNTRNIWAFYRMDNDNFEKKYHWYFKGYIQVLNDYLEYPITSKLIARIKFTFSIKMVLILGREALSKYRITIEELPLTTKLITSIIAFFPKIIRDMMLKLIL